MKIVFYSPYLPEHFGGGEKYLLDTALVYAAKHKVFIALSADKVKVPLADIKKQYQKFLGRDLSSLEFITTPLGVRGSRLQRLWWTAGYDVLYYVTDGSAFWSLARRNIMHIQVPLTLLPKKGWEKRKFSHFQVINANSNFTKKVVEKYWNIKVDLVCQPCVDVDEFQPQLAQKQKIILHVGRFFDNLHSKNQHVMVEMFAKLLEKEPALLRDWQLVLVGSVESESYLAQVKHLAKGLPVQIITNCKRERLVKLYEQASIYWHATGCLDDEAIHPEKMEHFGISTVEAMAAGCVPVVYARGGQKEILGHKLKMCGWQNESECLRITRKMIKEEKTRQQLAVVAMQQAQKYSPENFEKRCWQMLEKK